MIGAFRRRDAAAAVAHATPKLATNVASSTEGHVSAAPRGMGILFL